MKMCRPTEYTAVQTDQRRTKPIFDPRADPNNKTNTFCVSNGVGPLTMPLVEILGPLVEKGALLPVGNGVQSRLRNRD
jgi:hypothetical protein